MRTGQPVREGAGRPAALALCLAAAGLLAGAGRFRGAGVRGAQAIVADFDAVPFPVCVEGDAPEVHDAFLRVIEARTREQGRLALELFRAHPASPEVPRLMGSRWHLLRTNLGDCETVLRETAEVLAAEPRAELLRVALVQRAGAAVISDAVSPAERRAHVEAALAVAPEREAARLLWDLATRRLGEPRAQRELLARLVREHRGSELALDAVLQIRLLERLEEPLALDLEDVLEGGRLTDEDLPDRDLVLLLVRTARDLELVAREVFARTAHRTGDERAPALVCVWETPLADAPRRAREAVERTGVSWRMGLDRVAHDGSSWVDGLQPAVTPLFLRLDAGRRATRVSTRLATVLD